MNLNICLKLYLQYYLKGVIDESMEIVFSNFWMLLF